MGAQEFITSGFGDTVQEAFKDAVQTARYNYGNAGYTGSIAEKNNYKVIECEFDEVDKIIDDCLADYDHWCQDKWGDAGAVQLREGEWIFFGWASS